GQLQQLLHAGAAVVAGHRLVQPPPHPLHRVALRRVHRQVVQHHPTAPPLQVLLHQPRPRRLVGAGVVADHVHHPVAPERPPQLVQVPAEQRRAPPLLRQARRQDQPPGPPVDRPGQHPPPLAARGGPTPPPPRPVLSRGLPAPPARPRPPHIPPPLGWVWTSPPPINPPVPPAGSPRSNRRSAASLASRSGSFGRSTGRGRRQTSP